MDCVAVLYNASCNVELCQYAQHVHFILPSVLFYLYSYSSQMSQLLMVNSTKKFPMLISLDKLRVFSAYNIILFPELNFVCH